MDFMRNLAPKQKPVNQITPGHVGVLTLKRDEYSHAKTFFWDAWKLAEKNECERGFRHNSGRVYSRPDRTLNGRLSDYFKKSLTNYVRLRVSDTMSGLVVEAHTAESEFYPRVIIPAEHRAEVENVYRKRLNRDLFAKVEPKYPIVEEPNHQLRIDFN